MESNYSRLTRCCCSLLILFNLAACSSTAQQSGGLGAVNVTEQLLDERVFPKDKVVDVNVTLDSKDFQEMLEHAEEEEYKEASVEYNGLTFDHIGIRTKGNLSLRSVVQMQDSDRYSFKLSFDEYVNQTLDGISKINLNNNFSDASSMREFLTYELAEKMGLPVPKYSFVNLSINGELWGFYLAVEQIGDAYLNRHFGNAYGALYKAEMMGSGSDLTWLGDDPDAYTGLVLKSKEDNDHILITMLDELNNGTKYDQVLDVEESLKYIALNVLTNNTDSYIGTNKHNYYLYENNGIFSILPWDYNMAFGGLGGMPVNGRSREEERPAESSGLLIDEPTQGKLEERPLVAKLLEVESYKDLYHTILREAAEGYLENDTFSARVHELKSMIAPYVKDDPNAFYTYEEFQQAVPDLIAVNAAQIENITGQLDGKLPSSGDGSGSGGGMSGFPAGGLNRGRGQNTDTPEGFPPNGGQQMPMPPGDWKGGQAMDMSPERFPFGQEGRDFEESGAGAARNAGISILFLVATTVFIVLFRKKKW